VSLQLTGEQRAMVDIVRDFCAKEFATRAQRMALTEGGANPHNRDIAAKMGSLGWLGLSIPESCGGSGGGLFEACLFVEALSARFIRAQQHGGVVEDHRAGSRDLGAARHLTAARRCRRPLLRGLQRGRATPAGHPSRCRRLRTRPRQRRPVGQVSIDTLAK